jgi:hypothetical protein
MIEQTPLIVTEWYYHKPSSKELNGKIISLTTLDVMKKRTSTKKGIACRFTSSFVAGKESILVYIAEDSYVIDLADVIDKNELVTMVRNSFSKFKETFELRKLGTALQDSTINPLDENKVNFDAILPLLQ